jgi:hypothetical protein
VDAGEGQRYIQILAEIMKLRRACCNPQLVAPELGLPSSKLVAFGELLDELLANRHKALVFSQFVDHLGLIRAYLDEPRRALPVPGRLHPHARAQGAGGCLSGRVRATCFSSA